MKFGLEENIIEKLTFVLEDQPKVNKAFIFGSRAKGNYRPDSDIDIAVKGYDLTVEDILKMSAVIDKSGIGHEVDLVDYDSIKEQALKDHIDRAGSEFFARWKEYNLGDVITLKRGYDLPKQNRTVGTIPIYSSAGITDYNNLTAKEGPGVITGRYGTIGEVFYCNSSYWPLNTTLYVSDFKGNYPKFAYYLLKELDFEKYSDKSAVPGVNRNEIHKEIVRIPPNIDQVQIAEVLSSIDAKIDLLNRQNTTLESMSEALFRHWFMTNQKESTLINISDVAEINPDTISGDYPYSFIEYLDTGSITKGIIQQYQEYSRSEAPSRAQRIVEKNDIIYSLVRPIQRHYGILDNIKPNTIVSTGFCVIRCKEIWAHYVYILLTLNENVEYFDMLAEGATSAYPSLRPSDIADFEFALPDQERLKQFSEISIDAWKKIKANKNQIKTLMDFRDTLLPKLLSGEARVKMP